MKGVERPTWLWNLSVVLKQDNISFQYASTVRDNSIASTGNTPTVDAPTINTPTEKWERGAMTTEVELHRAEGNVIGCWKS